MDFNSFLILLYCLIGAQFSNDIDVLITHPNYVSESYEAEHKTEHTAHGHSHSILPSNSKESSKNLLNNIVEKLFEKQFLTDKLSHGDVKFLVRIA